MTQQDDLYDDEDFEADDFLEDDLDDEDDDENRETVAAVSGWGISIAAHAIVFLPVGFCRHSGATYRRRSAGPNGYSRTTATA